MIINLYHTNQSILFTNCCKLNNNNIFMSRGKLGYIRTYKKQIFDSPTAFIRKKVNISIDRNQIVICSFFYVLFLEEFIRN